MITQPTSGDTKKLDNTENPVGSEMESIRKNQEVVTILLQKGYEIIQAVLTQYYKYVEHPRSRYIDYIYRCILNRIARKADNTNRRRQRIGVNFAEELQQKIERIIPTKVLDRIFSQYQDNDATLKEEIKLILNFILEHTQAETSSAGSLWFNSFGVIHIPHRIEEKTFIPTIAELAHLLNILQQRQTNDKITNQLKPRIIAAVISSIRILFLIYSLLIDLRLTITQHAGKIGRIDKLQRIIHEISACRYVLELLQNYLNSIRDKIEKQKQRAKNIVHTLQPSILEFNLREINFILDEENRRIQELQTNYVTQVVVKLANGLGISSNREYIRPMSYLDALVSTAVYIRNTAHLALIKLRKLIEENDNSQPDSPTRVQRRNNKTINQKQIVDEINTIFKHLEEFLTRINSIIATKLQTIAARHTQNQIDDHFAYTYINTINQCLNRSSNTDARPFELEEQPLQLHVALAYILEVFTLDNGNSNRSNPVIELLTIMCGNTDKQCLRSLTNDSAKFGQASQVVETIIRQHPNIRNTARTLLTRIAEIINTIGSSVV
ncbi:MAG: hypothetical protein NZZ41_05725 [Candidatus Dojkabacteria bacterium]|nr:hypothetical protein [Candidatus Dojkabacteria bacterium]